MQYESNHEKPITKIEETYKVYDVITMEKRVVTGKEEVGFLFGKEI